MSILSGNDKGLGFLEYGIMSEGSTGQLLVAVFCGPNERGAASSTLGIETVELFWSSMLMCGMFA